MGQTVDALKIGVINGLAYTGLHNANCEGGDPEVPDNLLSFLKVSDASPQNPTTSHSRETLHDGLSGCYIAEQVQREVNDVDMYLFSVAYVSGYSSQAMSYVLSGVMTARHVSHPQ